jgi:uncharacterized membrane protein YphA (DoxX/SURF4 family)
MKRSLEFQGNSLNPAFLFFVRVVVASVWLHEGLWQKLIARDPHELSIVQQFATSAQNAHVMMAGIGAAETLMALAVLSGLFCRPLAWFQIFILLLMNAVGILFGHGTIADPIGLLIHNLPLVVCMALLGLNGPGAFALKWPFAKDHG